MAEEKKKKAAKKVEEPQDDKKQVEMTTEEKVEDILRKIRQEQDAFMSLSDEERKLIIDDFNSKDENKGVSELIEERPDEEYQLECKKQFEQYQNAPMHMNWKIGEEKNALAIAKMLQEWNDKWAFAEKNEWLGILYFHTIIEKKIEEIEKGDAKVLELDFNSLMYLNTIFANPYGHGYDYAQWMEKYASKRDDKDPNKVTKGLFDITDSDIADHMKTIQLINMKAALYRTKWSMACSGFKMNILIDSLEDFEKLKEKMEEDRTQR